MYSFTTLSLSLFIPAGLYLFFQRHTNRKLQQQIDYKGEMSNTNTVVILGGSYVGLAIAHSLLKHTLPNAKGLKVVVVSPNTHMYWNLASVRAIIPGQMADEKVSYWKQHFDMETKADMPPSRSFKKLLLGSRNTPLHPTNLLSAPPPLSIQPPRL
jgi:hypothetical protein